LSIDKKGMPTHQAKFFGHDVITRNREKIAEVQSEINKLLEEL
jgi:hypothetical protein